MPATDLRRTFTMEAEAILGAEIAGLAKKIDTDKIIAEETDSMADDSEDPSDHKEARV